MAHGDPNIKDRLLNELSSSFGPATDGLPIESSPPSPPVIPDHTLLRRIGKGSYGEVWLARNALGTPRAVKIVHRRAFDSDRPYEREFAGIRRFEPVSRSHPSQLAILHVGRNDEAGFFFYIMELADAANLAGEKVSTWVSEKDQLASSHSLAHPLTHSRPDEGSMATYVPRTLRHDLSHRGRLPCDECLHIGLALATALDHLHRHGLVHRDIKPSNIVFVGGIPKLADIGLVTHVEATLSFVGTEGYLPPEGPGTPQADIFSLGKVLYEMATGRDRQDYPELPTNLIAMPAADRAALAELNEVIVKACHADAKQRYQTAADLHADLALLQSGKSVSRMRTVERRLQFVARAGALVTVVALLAGGAWFWQQRQTRRARELARQNRELAETKTTLADEKTKLSDNLAKLGEENRDRIVRLDIANGIRLLDEGDPAGALLWFADALPLLTNNPAEESIHRIRIQQTLNHIPRPAQVLAHEHIVRAMAFSPDGKRVATGTEWGWVHLWDTSTGAALMDPYHLEGDQINQVAFTPDGQRLLVSTVIPDEPIPITRAAVIDVASGQRPFTKVATNLLRAEFIADGRWLVAAESDHVIRVLDGRDGSQVAALKGHTKSILAFSSSRKGDLVASTSKDGTIRLWRLPSGEPVGAPLPFQPPQHGPVLSPDGQQFATRDRIVLDRATNSTVRIWRTEPLTPIGSPIEASGTSGSMWFDSVMSRRRLCIAFGNQVRVFDADTQAELMPAIRFDKPMGNWATTQDGRRLMVGGREGVIGLWSLETGERLSPSFKHGRQILDLAFSPDGSHVASTTDEGVCVLWNVNLRQEDAVHRFSANIFGTPPEVSKVLPKRFSPDRRRFLLKLADGTVRLVDVERMAEQDLPGVQSANANPYACIFAPDGHQWAIAYSSADQTGSAGVELWRDEAGEFRRQMLAHPEGIPWMRFTPDSARLVTFCDDGQIRTWRTEDGTLERSAVAPEIASGDLFPDGRTALVVIKGSNRFALFDLVTGGLTPTTIQPVNVTGLAFDPTGERFATVTEEQWGRVWNKSNGAPVSPPVRHGGALTWADWSPDGKRVAMAGVTPEVRVWDASTGELSLPPLRLGDQPLRAVMWSLDGRFLVARSDENAARVWDAATGEPVTPLLKHDGYVLLAHLVASNRLITLSQPNLMRVWDLTETKLAADVIADYAKLVSGRRLNDAGVLLPLKPDELAELSRTLRSRAPELFP